MYVLKVKVISWPWPKVIYIWKLKLAFLRNDWAILNQILFCAWPKYQVSVSQDHWSSGFPYKMLSCKIWHYGNKGLGQLRIMVLNIKGFGLWCFKSRFIKIGPLFPGKKIIKCFTIYGHGSHLGHVNRSLFMSCHFFIPKSLHTKFGWKWHSGF